MTVPRILIVEDEDAIVTLLSYNLKAAGFNVDDTRDGDEALIMIDENPPDLIVLDWMLPMVSGIEVCRRLRRSHKTKSVPIIMLTARGEEADRIRGLEHGADDYMVKPFSPAELIARIHALLRRSRPAIADERLEFEDIVMDLAQHRVRRNNRALELSPTEFRLLQHFMENPGRVFSREQLLDRVWGNDAFVEPRTVDVHVRRLRRNLNEKGERDPIRTVRSAGYSLDQHG